MRREVLELLRAIAAVAEQHHDPRVRYSQLARKLHGSIEHTDRVKAEAEMPDVDPYVKRARLAIRLTTQGREAVERAAGGVVSPPRNAPPGAAPPPPNDPPTVIARIAQAVRQYQEGLQPVVIDVTGAEHVHRQAAGGRIVQALSVQASDEPFPTGAPVTYSRAGDQHRLTSGKIVGQEPDGARIYVALEIDILPVDLPGRLVIDKAFLLDALQHRLASLPCVPVLMDKLLYDAPPDEAQFYERDALGLADRLARLQPPWAKFLWGPPGAGKSYGIGCLLANLLAAAPDGHHLVVAPSNRAADVATIQFLKRCNDDDQLRSLVDDRRVLRFGYPRMSEVMEDARLRGPIEQDQLASNERKALRALREAEDRHESEDVLAGMRAELLDAQERLRDAVQSHVGGCAVVFTTSALTHVNPSGDNPIAAKDWDSVLVDEVTMVPPAQCVYLASLARERFLLAGDPRQLGPVFESRGEGPNVTEWMKRDVFDKTCVAPDDGGDARLTRIDSQRRCCRGIWEKVRSLYPHVADNVDTAELGQITDLHPKPGRAVDVLDTSGYLEASCERVHRSWRNIGTAKLAIEVACAAVGDSHRKLRVAVIAPYRAQVRELKRMLREELRADNDAYRDIEVGTVHQFQGSEADYVIFDVVDGRGRHALGALLEGDAGLRMVNVAITRARGKVVVIADRGWVESHVAPDQNRLLRDIVLGDDGVGVTAVLPAANDGPTLRTESPIERALLDAMKQFGELKDIVAQHHIHDEDGSVVSRADFAFPDCKYAVYCDGAEWHVREAQWQRDIRLRNKLAELGWIFSVFTGSDITRHPRECAQQVRDTYLTRSQHEQRGTD